jgi:hypothetical protein
MKKLLLSFILLSAVAFTASSQCTESYVGTNPFGPVQTGYLAGQSFTATCSGQLNYVQVSAATSGTIPAGTLSIYAGNGTGTTAIYTQPHAAITLAQPGPVQIMITGSLPITSGLQYTFEMFMTLDMDVGISTYSGGDVFQSGTNANPIDASFEADITIATGINESTLSNVIVSPNPATNVLNIASDEQTVKVEIYSINGALISSGNQKTIDISSLNQGMYLLMVQTDKGSTQTRFIKE